MFILRERWDMAIRMDGGHGYIVGKWDLAILRKMLDIAILMEIGDIIYTEGKERQCCTDGNVVYSYADVIQGHGYIVGNIDFLYNLEKWTWL